MQRIGFALGVGLVMSGGVFMPPFGLVLGLMGVALALVTGWRSHGAVVVSGLLIGIPLGALGIAAIVWWGNGHHTSWNAIQAVLLGGIVLLLAYIAVLLRRSARPSES